MNKIRRTSWCSGEISHECIYIQYYMGLTIPSGIQICPSTAGCYSTETVGMNVAKWWVSMSSQQACDHWKFTHQLVKGNPSTKGRLQKDYNVSWFRKTMMQSLMAYDGPWYVYYSDFCPTEIRAFHEPFDIKLFDMKPILLHLYILFLF